MATLNQKLQKYFLWKCHYNVDVMKSIAMKQCIKSKNFIGTNMHKEEVIFPIKNSKEWEVNDRRWMTRWCIRNLTLGKLCEQRGYSNPIDLLWYHVKVWNSMEHKKKIKIKKKKKKNMRKKEHVFNVTQSRRPKSTPPKVKWLYLAFTWLIIHYKTHIYNGIYKI